MISLPLDDELAALFHNVCEEIASHEEVTRLETLALADDRVCHAYLQYLALHGSLCLSHVSATKFVPVTLKSTRASRRFIPRLLALAASLLLVGYFVALGGLLIWDRIHPRDLLRDVAVQSVSSQFAKLVRAENCQWDTNSPLATVGSWLAPRELNLHTGMAEVQFADGATVTIEGPARFEPQATNRGFLHAGKLLAKVGQKSIGFTIETPSVTIVDLGTEFGVETSQHGATEVQVFKGKVELRPGAKQADPSSPSAAITLSAGEARKIERTGSDGNFVVRKITPATDRFARHIDNTELRQIRVQGALASSTYAEPDYSVNVIINGSGLSKGRHSVNPQGTMWFSELGKNAGQYLLFDLARPYRLNAMKVWNLNEAWEDMYRFRGLNQASIYVSTSGKGNPIDQPREWKLVVDHHQFSMATGKPDYATPDVIPLDDHEARFVALVIESTFGSDPRPGFGDKTAVGLSEVQFFGRPLSSRENKK